MKSAVNKPSFFRSIKSVAWSFVGIRKRSEFQQDFDRVSPLHVIVAGLLAVFCLILVIFLLVKWATGA